MFELKMVSWITGVPMFELLKSAMPERVEALRMELFSALRKTDTKRRKISRALKDMMRIGFKMLGETVSPEMETGNAITVAFSDVLPVNRLEEAQIEEIAIRNGITSRKSSMQRLYGFDEDMADKELQEINSETVQTGAVNPQQAPTL
jgi:SPP1 Gp6-like portal protein